MVAAMVKAMLAALSEEALEVMKHMEVLSEAKVEDVMEKRTVVVQLVPVEMAGAQEMVLGLLVVSLEVTAVLAEEVRAAALQTGLVEAVVGPVRGQAAVGEVSLSYMGRSQHMT